MRIERRFTAPGRSPFDQVEWTQRDCVITNPDGSVVYEMRGAEVPASWSQLARDIMLSKYFRSAGVPQRDGTFASETSVRQLVPWLAGCRRPWGEKYGYFDTAADAHAFYDELCYTLLQQMAAPNSP